MNEFLRQFRAQYSGSYDDLSDEQLAAAIHRRYYADIPFEQFVAQVTAKHGPPPEQPAAAAAPAPADLPPFAALPPFASGALDALVAFGNFASMGIPAMLSRDTREYVDELKERAPGAVTAAAAAGGLATGLAAKPLFMARTAMTGPYSVALGGPSAQAVPSIASGAARAVTGAVTRGARAAGPQIKTLAKWGLGAMGLDQYLRWRVLGQ